MNHIEYIGSHGLWDEGYQATVKKLSNSPNILMRYEIIFIHNTEYIPIYYKLQVGKQFKSF